MTFDFFATLNQSSDVQAVAVSLGLQNERTDAVSELKKLLEIAK